jgi:glucose-6-phosphate 1-dehydrogenase
MTASHSDALVLFGVTGDLAHKMIFPALYTMAKRGALKVPVISPSSLAARVKRAGKEFVGDQRELYLVEEQPGEESPYERLLGDAMAGDGALFTREDAVEAAWAVVEPVLRTHHRSRPYKHGSWGPKEADALIAADGCWHNPKLKETSG